MEEKRREKSYYEKGGKFCINKKVGAFQGQLYAGKKKLNLVTLDGQCLCRQINLPVRKNCKLKDEQIHTRTRKRMSRRQRKYRKRRHTERKGKKTEAKGREEFYEQKRDR